MAAPMVSYLEVFFDNVNVPYLLLQTENAKFVGLNAALVSLLIHEATNSKVI